MIITRVWEMPHKYTFSMKHVKNLILKYTEDGLGWVDPFSGENSIAEYTNDIEESKPARSHVDGLVFLKSIGTSQIDGCFFDPPYSPYQCLRSYKPVSKRSGKKTWGMSGMSTYHAECKDEIARVLKPHGISISFGWDTNGIGKTRGFEMLEVLDVCHGACHYDTLVTVERKL